MKHSLSLNVIIPFFTALLFAMGLGLGGMTQPQKIIGFLDLTGAWDPSLLFVMLGAVTVHFVTYKLVRKRKTPLLDQKWHVPTNREITVALVAGSFLFGAGWGLAGYCPGPALVSLASFGSRPLLFILGMLAGMIAFHLINQKKPFHR